MSCMDPVVSDSSDAEQSHPSDIAPDRSSRHPSDGSSHDRRTSLWGSWALFLLKNLIGWVFIIGAFLTGWLPGPGGIPMFLIGFGLVTFPGKRHFTARLLRGMPVSRADRDYRIAVTVAAVLFPVLVLGYAMLNWGFLRPVTGNRGWIAIGTYLGAVVVAWLLGLWATPIVNWILRIMAKSRKKVRPWLRARGIDLLPPRRRRRFVYGTIVTRDPDHEIIEIHQRHITRMRHWWEVAKPWLKRAISVAITVAIFVWILKPIVRNWPAVRGQALDQNWWMIGGASVMFAAFLFMRAMTWRRILRGMGHVLRIPPAMRIWSTSELARYLPGGVWQVVGRIYLAKPYGVRGSVTSASQIYELTAFLLANLIVAMGCLSFLGYKNLGRMSGVAIAWMIVAAALVPVLMSLLHPRVFHGIVDRVLARLKKPPLQKKLGFRALLRLLLRSVFMLLWQGLAIWVVVHNLLDLPLAKWWVVTGAYCLAWCAGFLAFWAPGGLGVREAVFIAAMDAALPIAFHDRVLGDPESRRLFLIFLSVLLRIWATAGELLLAGVAYALDYGGAIGKTSGAGGTQPREA